MHILVCGANGFIGRHLCVALEAAGHRVTRGVRRASSPGEVDIDFARDVVPEAWLPRLNGIDAVVNAVGILREGGNSRFDAIHRDAPCALFDACERLAVGRVVQISALGATTTPYMLTKRAADAHLMRSTLDWVVLRPSLVVGPDGDSSRMFRRLASLPLVGLPGRGDQLLQPVHIDDLCEAVVRAVAGDAPANRVIDAVGPCAMTYRDMLAAYRTAMGLPPPVWLPVPMPLMRTVAHVAAWLPQRVLAPDTLRMLEAGNAGDPMPFTAWIGRAPKGTDAWSGGVPSAMLRYEAIGAWAHPLLRVSLATVWIVTGILSLWVYPVAASLELLAQTGLHGDIARMAMLGAGWLDIAFGLATLALPSRLLWRSQMALIVAYSAIIAACLPDFWLHPFGPLLKNLPILAVLLVLDASQVVHRTPGSNVTSNR